MRLLLTLVTHSDGAPDDPSLQALAFARSLAPGALVHAVVIGPGAADAGLGLGTYGAVTVHVADHSALVMFAPDAWARILVDLAARLGADALIGPGSEAGNEVLARAAARLREPFAANCIVATPTETPTRCEGCGRRVPGGTAGRRAQVEELVRRGPAARASILVRS